MAIFNLYMQNISQTVSTSNTATVTINHQ